VTRTIIVSKATNADTVQTKTRDTRSRNQRCKLTPFFWRQFLVRLSCKSRTGFFWFMAPVFGACVMDLRGGIQDGEQMIF